jgi:hypothetical protein
LIAGSAEEVVVAKSKRCREKRKERRKAKGTKNQESFSFS